MLGGLAFAGAIMYLAATGASLELDKLVNMEKGAALIPAALLAFAGMTKSAQLPFSSWLLGAMVAPTPVSALLHSSTMVKAGVYLVLRLAPLLRGTLPGTMVALIGGVTFLLASLVAISQSDAKRVLAWSTIANLGLIVLCGGIGTFEALWAGILLILFHAVTKALLFLCVGTFEQKTNTRDIESMSGLIVTMPKLSIMIQVGIAGHVPRAIRDAGQQVGGAQGAGGLQPAAGGVRRVRQLRHAVLLGEVDGQVIASHHSCTPF